MTQQHCNFIDAFPDTEEHACGMPADPHAVQDHRGKAATVQLCGQHLMVVRGAHSPRWLIDTTSARPRGPSIRLADTE